MSNLTEQEEVRLSNLKLLHGSAVHFGAPTSDGLAAFFSSKKAHISQPMLSDFYQRKKSIDQFVAERIERAFELPKGWLSQDQSFWQSVSPEDAVAIKLFFKLSQSVKSHVAAIIKDLNNISAQPNTQPDEPENPGTPVSPVS